MSETPLAVAALTRLLGQPGSQADVLVEGLSMGPALPAGASARIRGDHTYVPKSGDVIAFLAGGRVLTIHRVIGPGVTGQFVLTRGDANLLCDPPLPLSDILGYVEACRVGTEPWRGVSGPPDRRGLRRWIAGSNGALMSGALAIHVRLAQGVALASLLFALPRALLTYRLRALRAPALKMLRLKR